MKKSILAVVVPALFAASSAVAGVKLVESDDITIDFNGDIDLKIVNMDDKEKTQIEANFDDIDFTFSYKIDDNLTVIAETDFTMEYEKAEGLENTGAWVGFQTNYGLLRAGYMETSFDPLGIDNAELMPVGMSSGDTDGSGTSHETAVLYQYKTDNTWVSATYAKPETGADASEGDSDTITPEVMQIAAITTFGDLEIGGGYGEETKASTADNTVDDIDAKYYQAQAEYKLGNMTVGVLYGHQDEQIDDVQTQGIEFDMTYKINSKIKVMGGFERISQDISGVTGNDDLDLAYLGMTYKFSKYVKLYAEVGKKEGEYAKYGSTSTSTYDQNMVGLMLGVDF